MLSSFWLSVFIARLIRESHPASITRVVLESYDPFPSPAVIAYNRARRRAFHVFRRIILIVYRQKVNMGMM